jgi:putative transposase
MQKIVQCRCLRLRRINFVGDLAAFHIDDILVRMDNTTLNTLNHCVFSLNFHLVLVTKSRKRALTAEMLSRFDELARERATDWNGSLIEINGESDHVHLLLSLPPTIAIADFVNALKTGTSRRLRSEFKTHLGRFYREPVLWSRSYCVLSCGGAPLEVIKQYIQQQDRPKN